MIILPNSATSLEVVLLSAVTTNELNCVAARVDFEADGKISSQSAVLKVTNGTTHTTLAAGPGGSYRSRIMALSVFNKDTVAATAVLKINDGSTRFTLYQAEIPVGGILQYNDTTGWSVLAANGVLISGVSADLVGKRSRARAATTANIVIATALNNGDTLDGVTLATGDLVLVKDQTAPEENGVYVVGATPARFSEFDSYNEHPGSLIGVEEGTANADTLWFCTSNNGGTLDATAIVFTKFATVGGMAPLASPTFTGTVTAPAIVLSSETASTLASFDGSKNIKSLATASYPSLAEIAHVKGVTSAIQTQLDAKAPSTSPTLVTPNIGAATGTSLAVTGALTSSGGGVGYATGAGGAVTQLTDATTGVELNKLSGQITTVALDHAAGVDFSFTLTNSQIAAGDVVVASIKSYGGTADGIPVANVVATAAGSCVINVRNTGAVALDALAVINFAVIKAVAA